MRQAVAPVLAFTNRLLTLINVCINQYLGNKANNFNETELVIVIGSVMLILKDWLCNGIIWI